MDTMNVIVALVIGLVLIAFGLFFGYKYVYGAAEDVGTFTPDEEARAKEQCELACAQGRLSRNCAVWRKNYCDKIYLDKTCGMAQTMDIIAECDPPELFSDGSSSEGCKCPMV